MRAKNFRQIFAWIVCLASLPASPAQRGRLLAVRAGGDASTSVIELIGDRPLSFTTLRLSGPPRVVVDFADAELGGAAAELSVDDGTVRRVGTTQASVRIARVVIELSGEAEFDVRAKGSALEVRVPRLTPLVAAAIPEPPPLLTSARQPEESAPPRPAVKPAEVVREDPPPEVARNEPPAPPVEVARNQPPAPPVEVARNEPPAPPVEFARNEPPAPPVEVARNQPPAPPVEFARNEPPPAPPLVAREQAPPAPPLEVARAEPPPSPPAPRKPTVVARSEPPPEPQPRPRPIEPPAPPHAEPRAILPARPVEVAAAEPRATLPPPPPERSVPSDAEKRASLPTVALVGPTPHRAPSTPQQAAPQQAAPQPPRAAPVETIEPARREPSHARAPAPAQQRTVASIPQRYSITGIGFRQLGAGAGVVVVRSDRPLEYSVTGEERAVLLHLVAAHVPVANNRLPLDTSFFNGPVLRVVPLQTAQGTDLRVELREHAEYQIEQSGSVLTLTFQRP